jgi:hypothetical protein
VVKGSNVDRIMANPDHPECDSSQPAIYQIRIGGHLGCQWVEWFEGLTLMLEENGDTVLTGPVADQAALYGLLRKVRDLGVSLISVNRVEPDAADPPVRGQNRQ